jgi:hypothetical protein
MLINRNSHIPQHTVRSYAIVFHDSVHAIVCKYKDGYGIWSVSKDRIHGFLAVTFTVPKTSPYTPRRCCDERIQSPLAPSCTISKQSRALDRRKRIGICVQLYMLLPQANETSTVKQRRAMGWPLAIHAIGSSIATTVTEASIGNR